MDYNYYRPNTFINNISNLSNKYSNKNKELYQSLDYSSDIKKKRKFFTQDGNSVNIIPNYQFNGFSDMPSSQIQLLPKNSSTLLKDNDYRTTIKTEIDYNSPIDNQNINNYDDKKLNLTITSKVGLKNLGNSCYMNTCLQILIHSKDFIKRLLSKKILINKSTPISYYFSRLIEEIIYSNTSSIEPSEFKKIVSKQHPEFPEFRGYSQFDTQEFCRIILEDMNNELNEIKDKIAYKELKTDGKTKSESDKEYDKLFRSRESSIIIDTFYGQFINIFICNKCKSKSFSFQKVLDLPLLMPENNENNDSNQYISIKELLNDYFKEDEEIKFKCEKCNKKRRHKKEIKISQSPNILILSLQRIFFKDNKKKKNKSKVKFGEKLSIKDYIDEDCGHMDEYKYYLYGIACHAGDINFGHYFAYIKINDKDWYEFNDSKIKYIGDNIISETNFSYAYALFYKKIK